MITYDSLNKGQLAAADGFFKFLLSEEKEMIITGAGGYGKTFLMGYLIDKVIPKYHETCKLLDLPPVYNGVVMTAPTNQAANVLTLATGTRSQTIHSFLGLRVFEDFDTGKTKLSKTKSWTVHQNIVLFIDEYSYIDSSLLNYIRQGTENCKIVFVGDKDQLPSPMEQICPIDAQVPLVYELTEPMRNADQPALRNVCSQLRDTVRTGIFKPITPIAGVIDYVQSSDMPTLVEQHFLDLDTESKILAYTNQRVIEYNNYIRNMRQLPIQYSEGEHLISNSMFQLKNSSLMFSVGEEFLILRADPKIIKKHVIDDIELDVYLVDLKDSLGEKHYNIPIPANYTHYHELIKYFARNKNWQMYFTLKNTYPDLRSKDASTVHKAQGSTYDTVFIDMDNLSQCRNPVLAARLLYVAFSRAKSKVIMYGNLATKFGGITQ